MAVDYRHRRRWEIKQGRLPAGATEAIMKMFHTFGQRPGESDDAFMARLTRQNDLFMLQADLDEAAVNDRDEKAGEPEA